MCGRYSLTRPKEAVRQLFNLSINMPLFNELPRFNIAPSQLVPVICSGDRPTDWYITGMTWGFYPSWGSGPDERRSGQINARSETVSEKPFFKLAYEQRRCLVPSDGFYEWQKIENDTQPYWISRRDKGPFAFAGIWETWSKQNFQKINSFAILTTVATPTLHKIHHRMPVILQKKDYNIWLDPNKIPPQELFNPDLAPHMEAHPVSSKINNPRYDKAECIKQTSLKPTQGSLF